MSAAMCTTFVLDLPIVEGGSLAALPEMLS